MERLINNETGNQVSRLTSNPKGGREMFTVQELKRAILLNACDQIDAVIEWEMETEFTDSMIHEIREQTKRNLSRVDDSEWIQNKIEKGGII